MPPILTAVGNACTDLIASVSEDFLAEHGIRKHHCTHLTTADDLNALKSALPACQTVPGGAGANVAHVVAALGGDSHFIGKIAADRDGFAFRRQMEENSVACDFPPPSPPEIGSPQVLCLMTPDGERTFVSYDGVARYFSSDDYNFDVIRRSAFLYLDGYSFCSDKTEDSFLRAAQAAAKGGGKTIFNLGDLSIYETNPAAVERVLNRCDGIICNAPEAQVLFGSDTLQTILTTMQSRFSLGAVTHGADGAYVFANGETAHIPAEDVSALAALDTNGAGDHFSGGFLYGLMNGFTLEQAGKLGNLCARDCLSHPGARPLGGQSSLNHLAVAAKTR